MKLNFSDKHPGGLYLLFFVEMWERFSYYGMRALLVLYVMQYLFESCDTAISARYAGNIYGTYTGLVYLTPLAGGYIADRFLGQRKCISAGALVMIAGLLFLSLSGFTYFETMKFPLFTAGLFLMIVANGLVKSNISTVVGKLYETKPQLKDSAFTVFYMGINFGAFLSPLICGTIAYKYGFQYGFISSGIGMLIGYIIYKAGERSLLGECGMYPHVTKNKFGGDDNFGKEELHRLYALFILMIFSIIFWICYEQAGSSLALFAENETRRSFAVAGNTINVPSQYFQSLNPLFIIVLAPLMSAFWQYLDLKNAEPPSVTKFIWALSLISCTYLIMSGGTYFAQNGLVSPLWLVAVFFTATVSELCISPIGLSLVTKLAPAKFTSLIMGCWFFSSFFGNLIAGFFAGNYERISHPLFFLILAGVAALTTMLLISVSPVLKKWMGKY